MIDICFTSILNTDVYDKQLHFRTYEANFSIVCKIPIFINGYGGDTVSLTALTVPDGQSVDFGNGFKFTFVENPSNIQIHPQLPSGYLRSVVFYIGMAFSSKCNVCSNVDTTKKKYKQYGQCNCCNKTRWNAFNAGVHIAGITRYKRRKTKYTFGMHCTAFSS